MKGKKQYKTKCWVCDRTMSMIEQGHLIDKFLGGSNAPSNIRPMCYDCNRIKPGHNTLFEVVEWKVKRHHEVMYGQSKELSFGDFLYKMRDILLNDFNKEFIVAWSEYKEFIIKEEQEEEKLKSDTKKQIEEQKINIRLNEEGERLWRSWCELENPPEVNKDGDMVIITSIIPCRPGGCSPKQKDAWERLWLKLTKIT